MLHVVHAALSRSAALDPYRLRHYLLVAAATVIALGLVLNSTITATLAAAAESDKKAPASQLFIAAPDLEAPSAASAVAALSAGDESAPAAAGQSSAREAFTVDVRPPLVYPVGAGAPVGSSFGPRAKGCAACTTDHRGVDWNPGYGTPVVSIADGIVSGIGNSGAAYGVHLTIDHVVNGQAVTSLYAHMQPGSIPVSVGDRVRVGDQVGLVGSTGVVTAPHLHFEIQIGGTAINPVPWMAANGAQ